MLHNSLQKCLVVEKVFSLPCDCFSSAADGHTNQGVRNKLVLLHSLTKPLLFVSRHTKLCFMILWTSCLQSDDPALTNSSLNSSLAHLAISMVTFSPPLFFLKIRLIVFVQSSHLFFQITHLVAYVFRRTKVSLEELLSFSLKVVEPWENYLGQYPLATQGGCVCQIMLQHCTFLLPCSISGA